MTKLYEDELTHEQLTAESDCPHCGGNGPHEENEDGTTYLCGHCGLVFDAGAI